MDGLLLGLLAWLQVKHFAADYLLQTPWIIAGKGDFRRAGGYVHAAIHVAGTLPGLVLCGLGAGLVALVLLCEFVIHFAIDHLKALQARARPQAPTSSRFWAMHGADQLAHHLTYTAILAVTARVLSV
jgi:hypothetical protein